MSSNRYYENPFEEYNPTIHGTYMTKNKLNENLLVATKVEEKWFETMRKLEHIDFTDYSVYTGTSGIALLQLLKLPHTKENLREIKQLLTLHRLKNRRHSFLCGDAGPLAIGAIVTHELEEHEECKMLLNRLISMHEQAIDPKSDLPNEYLYGRAGYLFALLYVNKHISPPPIEESLIRKIIETVLICGQKQAKSGKFKCPLMYKWHDRYYLGAAHGVSGIIYLLLQAKQYLTDTEIRELIKPTISYLTSLQLPSGNFPSSLGSDTDKYVQWCHGAPGFVYMYSIAYKVFQNPKYKQLALEAGEVIWRMGLLRKGYSLCHGVAGNAYPFLELYQLTNDTKHLHRAIMYTEWCLDYQKTREGYAPDRPLSLFEGIAGPMYLLIDIQKPKEAKFPGFTL